MKKLRLWVSLILAAALWAPLATSLRATSANIVISEFRVRGPSGGNDEFIELHNISNVPVNIGGWKVRGSNVNAVVGDRATITAGTIVGAGCYYLLTNSAASGYSGAVTGNQTYSTGVTDDGGIAITLPDNTIIDAVGMSAGSAFKEGTPLASLGSSNQNRGSERRPGGPAGNDSDTDNNATDFQLIAPSNPQNSSSPCITYPPSVAVGDVSVSEGNSGQTQVTFTVTAGGTHGGITFDIAVVSGLGANGATAGSDFSAPPDTGSIAAGTNGTFLYTVDVFGDVTFEQNETYSVMLSNVVGARVLKGTAIGTIVNDDPAPPVNSDVVISQVYGGGGNSGATLTHDFVELFNRGTSAVNVTGWSVQYASSAGSTWQVTPISGTIQPGSYYLIQQAAEGGGSTPLPATDATGTIEMAAPAGKVALQMNTAAIAGNCPSANTADLVGYGGAATCFETAPTAATNSTTAALRKRGGCIDTNNNSVDFSVGAPLPRNSSSSNSCTPTTLTISQIQGNGPTTTYAGQFVATTGIVTARKSNGFFLQSPAPGDGDDATSDALFVFTDASVTVGNGVLVQGTASEFFDLTQVEATMPGDVTVQSPSNPLPGAVTLTSTILDPNGTHDQLERLESMRVFASSLTSVAPSNEFGEIDTVLTGVPRPMREPGIPASDPVPVDPSSGVEDCCIPRFDENPERIMVDTDALAGSSPLSVTTHVVLTNISGPLDFAFGRYKIAPEAPPSASANISGVPVPAPAADEFTVAGFNIENFTGVDPQLTKASLAIRQLMHSPDVIGHIEILDLTTLQSLASKVNADAVAAGEPDPQYEALLTQAPAGGTQNVGFLVKTSRVRIDSFSQELGDEMFPPGDTDDELHDRPPLVLRATFGYNGPNPTAAIVVINHTRSFIGVELTNAEGERVRAKRTAQAESIAQLLQDLQTANPGVPVISLGDYNAYEFNDGYTDPIAVLKGQPTPDEQIVVDGSPDLVDPNYINLTDSLPADQRYSFIFEGTPQALDHVLVNTVAEQYVQRYAIVRGNADFPEVPAALYAGNTSRPERSSDHDMPVAYFRFPDVTDPVITVPADITVSATGPQGAAVSFTATATDNTDGAITPVCVPASGSTFAIGTTAVVCTATDAAGNSATGTFNVTVTDPQTAGAMHGGGTVRSGTNEVAFAFEVRETGAERGFIVATIRQGLRIKLLISLRVDSVFFTNNAAFTPGPRPPSGNDSVVFSGPAWVNGDLGYTYEARATDQGEPGKNDTFALIVRNGAGQEVANVSGKLKAGNIQSRR